MKSSFSQSGAIPILWNTISRRFEVSKLLFCPRPAQLNDDTSLFVKKWLNILNYSAQKRSRTADYEYTRVSYSPVHLQCYHNALACSTHGTDSCYHKVSLCVGHPGRLPFLLGANNGLWLLDAMAPCFINLSWVPQLFLICIKECINLSPVEPHRLMACGVRTDKFWWAIKPYSQSLPAIFCSQL